MSCVEKACVWPAEKNGYCVFHARMFEEIAGRYAAIRPKNPRPRVIERAEHILLHRAVFRREDKEPFEKSGFSLLGALEYDQNTDNIRCHECGEFRRKLLPGHLATHDITGKDYRWKHGLHSGAPLCGLFVKHDNNPSFRVPLPIEKLRELAEVARKARPQHGPSVETLNLRNRCRLQMIARLQKLAEEFHRTPTTTEILNSGLALSALRRCFGSLDEAMKEAGLTPRPKGNWSKLKYVTQQTESTVN